MLWVLRDEMCFRLVECNLHFFSVFSIYLFIRCKFFLFFWAIYKSGARSALHWTFFFLSTFSCHLWSRWQTAILYIWVCSRGMPDDDVARRTKRERKRDRQALFKIMERKHGFNCNIMHESTFKWRWKIYFTMVLAPCEDLCSAVPTRNHFNFIQ